MRSFVKGSLLKPALWTVCFVVLGWMVWQAGPHALWYNVNQMRWLLLLCILVWGVGYLFNTVSWGVIIGCYPQNKPLTAWRLLQLTVSGYALNYVTPLGLLGGEPYRVVSLRHHLGIEQATSSVLLYAMMHFCSHFLFWMGACVAAVFVVPQLEVRSSIALLSVSLLCVALLSVFLQGYRKGRVAGFVRRLVRLPWIGKKLEGWYRTHNEQLSSIDRGIALLLNQHPWRFVISLAAEVVSRLVCCLEIMMVVTHLQLPLGYIEAFLIVAFSSLFANLLFFTPLQMGTREGGILLSMQWLMPELTLSELLPLAVCISMATRIREFAWILIGLICIVLKKER